jgi:hypothetical protein
MHVQQHKVHIRLGVGKLDDSWMQDHPALVQSPADTNSTMNTMETRRLSAGDTRRLSDVRSRRMSLQVRWLPGAVFAWQCSAAQACLVTLFSSRGFVVLLSLYHLER